MRGFRGAVFRSILRAAAAAQWLGVAAFLAACAPAPLQRAGPVGASPAVQAQAAFEVSGRLSARHGSAAVAASFRWSHSGERDALELASPFGQTLALLSGDASEVRMQAADGRVLTAADWTALTQQGLGWPLPVQGLAFWIQGTARPGAPSTVEAASDGRLTLLRQDGWTIVYQSYAQAPEDASRPVLVTLTYPDDVELRVAIDRWQ
jgi:outer membrane lipoprotein LolB